MKSLLSIAIVAMLAAPAVSFAQSSTAPVTRAQVRAELVRAEQQGLVGQDDVDYPKLAPRQTSTTVAEQGSSAGQFSPATDESAGSSQSGSFQAGHGIRDGAMKSIYFGH